MKTLLHLSSKLCLTVCFGYFMISSSISLSAQSPYQDSSLSAEQRAEDLLHRLTLEEKVSLMQNNSPAIERLGIRPYEWWNEALHGVARAGLATVFPQTIGMAASFNDSLLYEVFNAVSDEARAKNRDFNSRGEYKRYQGLTMWTPNINIFRDPRWGRGQETYGEDPYLTALMGLAVVKGLQGPDSAQYDKLHACAKHYAVHSGPEWNRHSFDAKDIDPRDLWETYLPAFKTLVQDGKVKEVMCAYNRYEGEPCCGSKRLLTQILRDEWGFDGIVVSDCWAISDFWRENRHLTHKDAAHASADAVLSGTDLECGGDYRKLTDAVKAGYIDEEQINVSLRRLLKARFELGEMEEEYPWQIPYSVVDCDAHKALALEMARQTMTLLQNNNNVLPLDKKAKIALIGPNANDSVMQWANYNGFPSHTSTLLSAMQSYLPESQLIYTPACGATDGITYRSLLGQCNSNGQQGFSASYWNNPSFEGAIATTDQISTPFHFNTLGATTFAPGVNLTDFSGRYQTTLTPTKDCDAIFLLKSNEAITISVNGQEVVNSAKTRKAQNEYSMPVKAGEKYNIELSITTRRSDSYLNFDVAEEVPFSMQTILQEVKDADVVVFAGGISAMLEGEEMPVDAPGFKRGDRTDIELPAIQREILAGLKQAGKKVVFVNYSGSAMALVPETESCDAILQAWYPGQAGGQAVVEVLYGDYNPSGKLPVTFYKNTNQLPDFEDYSMKGRTYRYMTEEPLFPFGYGLSYTAFAYEDAKLNKQSISQNEEVELIVPVSNTGDMDGDEIVQIYLKRNDDKDGPQKALRSFKRTHIKKGESQIVTIPLSYDDFNWFDTETNTMRTIPGNYEILYGGSSRNEDLKSLTIQVD